MYIDVDKATRLSLIGKILVYLNGKEIKNALAAKHGRNGFVSYQPKPVRVDAKGDVVTLKKRGNVKVSFNLWGRL